MSLPFVVAPPTFAGVFSPGLISRLPVGVYRTAPDGRILAANEALARLLGVTDVDELLSTSALEFYMETTDRAWEVQEVRRLPDDATLMTAEIRLRRRDGVEIWARDWMRAERDASGEIIFIEGFLEDITDQKATETALAESLHLLDQAFASSPIGMALLDGQLRQLRTNPALIEMVGMTEDEFAASRLSDFLLEDEGPETFELWDEIRRGERDGVRVERRLRRGDGGTLHAIVDVSVVRGEDGGIRLVLVQVVDISERVASEQALVESQATNAALIRAIPDLMFRVHRDGRFVGYHPGSAAAPELTLPSDFIGKTFSDLMPPEQADRAHAVIAAGFERGEPHTVEYRILGDTDGRVYEATLSPINDTEILAMVRDVTEAREMVERLERLVVSKDEFIASVSHELRTPLTTVYGLAEELRSSRDVLDRAEVDELIDLIADQAAEMSHIVEDLLVAARADIGKVSVASDPVDLADVVDSVLAAFPGRAIRVMSPDGPSVAVGDAARLRQILRNLVTNAIRYGGRSITVSAWDDGRSCGLRVTDDGEAIPEDRREAIFDPYQRAHDRAGQPASVGLGLTVSRKLARLMRGDLSYEHDGSHSVFVLSLPALREPGGTRSTS